MDMSRQSSKSYDYDAWGKVTEESGSLENEYTFTSRRDEKDLGLMYYRHRYYDPETGRFISQDPFSGGPDDARVSYRNNWFENVHGKITLYTTFRQPHTFNRYVYCSNNPINFTDPMGLYGEEVHYRLTKSLAINAGFSRKEAEKIAHANLFVDKSSNSGAFVSESVRSSWHFPSKERLSNLKNKAFASNSLYVLGEYLHAFQDSYSHQKGNYKKNGQPYGAKWGHLFDGKNPDIISKRPALAYRMAYETYKEMLKYQKVKGKRVRNRWHRIRKRIRRFLS
jgi:RHS repeat-associated protein